jgi:multidrug resistance protein, MATE family
MSLASDAPLESARASAAGGSVREVLELAYPVVLTTMSTTAMNLVDTAMVGRLGATEVGAVGFGGIVLWTFFSLFYGTTSGVQTFVSQAHGAGNPRACGPWLWHGLYAVVPPLIVTLLAMSAFLEAWVGWMGASDALSAHAIAYVSARLPGELGMAVMMVFASFFRGLGDTRTPLYAALFGNAVNALLAYALIFGEWGLPAWGVAGAGVATACGHWSIAVVLAAALARPALRRRHATGPVRPELAAIRRFLRTGAPVGGEWFMGMTSYAVFTALVARMGDAEMAASQMFVVLLSVSYMQAIGIATAAATLAGRFTGAGDHPAVERSFRSSLALGALLSSGLAVVYVTAGGPLLRLFTDDPAVIALGRPLLAMGAAYQIFDALGIIAEGALRGAGDTRWPFAVHTVLNWVFFVPLAYLLGVRLDYGLFGAWCGGLVFVVALAALLAWRFRSGAWRRIRI